MYTGIVLNFTTVNDILYLRNLPLVDRALKLTSRSKPFMARPKYEITVRVGQQYSTVAAAANLKNTDLLNI